jgi:hypothetical protein
MRSPIHACSPIAVRTPFSDRSPFLVGSRVQAAAPIVT